VEQQSSEPLSQQVNVEQIQLEIAELPKEAQDKKPKQKRTFYPETITVVLENLSFSDKSEQSKSELIKPKKYTKKSDSANYEDAGYGAENSCVDEPVVSKE
jgi:hypothetical protein